MQHFWQISSVCYSERPSQATNQKHLKSLNKVVSLRGLFTGCYSGWRMALQGQGSVVRWNIVISPQTSFHLLWFQGTARLNGVKESCEALGHGRESESLHRLWCEVRWSKHIKRLRWWGKAGSPHKKGKKKYMWINRNAVPVGPFPKNAITAKICGSVIQLDNCLRGKNKNIYPVLHMINLILYKCVSTTNLESDTCNPHRRLKQRHKKTFKVKQVTLWEVPHLDPVKYVVWKEHQPVGPSQQARMGHGWISCENWVNMKVEDVCLLRYQYTQDGGSGGIIHNIYL